MTQLETYHFGEKISHVEYHPEDLSWPEHLHRSFELWFGETGEFLLTIDSETFTLKAGDIALILPYQNHQIESTAKNSGHIWIFSPEYLEDYLPLIKGKSFLNPVIPVGRERSQQLYESLFESDSFFRHKSALYEILYMYEQHTKLVKTRGKENILELILLWVSTHFQSETTLANLSEDIGYSKDYVSKVIAQKLNATFPKLINQYRINHACFLLANSDYSITEIANLSGFQNSRTFNRNFLQKMSRSPKDYRQNARSISKKPTLIRFDNPYYQQLL